MNSLDHVFHPRSIAVVGVSSDMTKASSGRSYLQAFLESGFKGRLYPVNPTGGEVLGLRVFRTLREVPDEIDYAILAIPAQHAMQVVRDCAAKGVKTIHLFTAGFTETGSKEGERLESDTVKLARQTGIRIIGPNSMGLYCPATGLSFARGFPGQSAFPRETGHLGFMAQSGTNSIYCVRQAAAMGMYFSKLISYGNASDLNESDFLEYLGDDPDTRVIGAYIEGVKDGPRFARALRKAAVRKPVIVFKVGTTESGVRAASSHTASIAGSNSTWETLLKQSGAIQVHSIEEMVDIAQLYLRMPVPKGRNTAVVGSGGGPTVKAADDCSAAGLNVPALSTEVLRKLKDLFDVEVGLILKNPVDTLWNARLIPAAVHIVAASDQIDLIMVHVAFDVWALVDAGDIVQASVESILGLRGATAKPVIVVLHYQASDRGDHLASEARLTLGRAGFPVYPSIARAATAVRRLIEYYARVGPSCTQ